jgi:tetratricopeptide (TPR) repeat protein
LAASLYQFFPIPGAITCPDNCSFLSFRTQAELPFERSLILFVEDTVADYQIQDFVIEIEETYDEELQNKIDEANNFLEEGNTSRALSSWSKIVRDNPDFLGIKLKQAEVYKEMGRWKQYVDNLKEVAEKLDEDRKQDSVNLLKATIPVLRDEMKIMPKVVKTYKKLMDIVPDDDDIFEELVQVIGDMNRWPDLAKVYDKRFEALEDETKKIELLEAMAELYEDKLHNKREGINTYEKLLELDPTNKTAIAKLKEMYEQGRKFDKLIELSKTEMENISDSELVKEKSIELAQMASSKIRKPETLIELWEDVVELDPENIEALEELENLYEKARNYEKMTEIAERKLELMVDEDSMVKTCLKIAPIYERKLNDSEKAKVIWRKLLELQPEERRAQDSLKKLLVDDSEWDELEALYTQWDKLSEFIRIISQEVRKQKEDEDKVALLFREARLWRDTLNDVRHAIKAYESLLKIDKENLEAANALIELYEAEEQFRNLPDVLEIRINNTQEEDLKRDRMEELAHIYNEHLNDKESSFEWYLKSFEIEPQRVDIREKIEELALGVKKGWDKLVETYTSSYDKFTDQLELLPLMKVVLKAQEEELDDNEGALKTALAILEIEDSNQAALDACERIYRSKEGWNKLLDIYTRKIELSLDDEEIKDLYWKKAEIFDGLLEKPEEAVTCYNAVLDIVPDDINSLGQLDNLYQRLEMWMELSSILERELEFTEEDEQKIEFKFRWSQLQEEKLDNIFGAIEGYKQVLEWDSKHQGARKALENHLQDEDIDNKRKAADILEPVYTELEQFKDLVQVHEIQAETESDPIVKLELLLTTGKIWSENLANIDKAFEAYSSAVQHKPESEEARENLEQIASIEEKWDEVFKVYTEVLEDEMIIPEVSKLLHIRCAEIANTQLNKKEEAIANYRAALELDSMNQDILKALEILYSEEENWESLLEISRRELELAQDLEERQQLRFRCGKLLDEKLDKAKEASEIYEEILGEESDNIEALHALDHLYSKLEMWIELADNLNRQLELTFEPDEKLELFKRLAKLQHEKLEETAIAIETWKNALEIEPEDSDVIAALESLLDSEDYALTVVKILEPIYQVLSQWNNLIKIYRIIKDKSFDPEEQIELQHKIAGLYEDSLEELENAFKAYGGAFEIRPRHEETREHLERLSQVTENWEALFDLYSKKIEENDDVEVSLMLQTRIAELLATAVGDIDRAAKAYNKVLDIKLDHLPTIDSLEQLYIDSGNLEKQVETILRKVEMVFDIQKKKELAFKAADIQMQHLENEPGAVKTYRLILEIDDTEMRALDALESIFVNGEQWENLEDIYSKKADLAPSLEERKSMLFVAGQMYDTNMNDTEKAIETFEKIIDEDPMDSNALGYLDALYERVGKWQQLINILEAEIGNAESDAERASYKLRLANIYELELKEPETAVPLLREALDFDPNNTEIISSLARIMNGGKNNEELDTAEIEYPSEVRLDAARKLDEFYTRMEEPENLVEVLEVMVEQNEDSFEKVRQLHRIVELHETNLMKPEEALAAVGRALKFEPRNPKSLEEIERIATITESWDWLIRTYDEVIENLEMDEDKIFFQLKIARILEQEQARPKDAIERLVKVKELDPVHPQALEGLDRLYEIENMWPELSEILQLRIENAVDLEVIQELRYKQAKINLEYLNNHEKAVETLQALLEEAPEHEGGRNSLEVLLEQGILHERVYRILEPIYRRDEKWEKVVEFTEMELKFVNELEARIPLFKSMCEIYENYLFDAESAFRTYARILEETVDDVETCDKLEELAASLSLWIDLTEVYEKVAKNLTEQLGNDPENEDLRESIIRIWLKAARVYEEELQNPAGAENSNLEVLKLEKYNFKALESLDRIYTANNMYAELADTLRKRAESTEDSYEKIQFLFRLARLCEESLQDYNRAIIALEDIYKEESDNMESLESLERLQFQLQNWKDLFNVYDRMTNIFSSDEDRADAISRMAKISSDGLNDPVNAKTLWMKVLDVREEDACALKELAFLAEQDENWEATVDFLDRITQASYEISEQVDAYLNLGRVSLEHLDDHRKAMDAYLNVRSIDPDNLEALDKLSFIYEESQAWEELVEVLETLVRAGAQSMEAVVLRDKYARIGQIEKEYLVRTDRAITAYEKVLDYVEGDKEALEALELLYTQDESWNDTIRILGEKFKITPEKEQKIAIMLQVAQLWENKLDEKAATTKAYQRILSIEPLHKEAFDNLERLYTELSDWDNLVELYLHKFENLGGQEEVIPDENKKPLAVILQKLAAIYEEKMNDRKQAWEILADAFFILPTDNKTARKLEAITAIEENWDELIGMYEDNIAAIDDRKIKCDLLVKTGRWYCEQLEDLDKASEVLKRALKFDSTNGAVHLVLAEVHRRNNSISEYILSLKKALDIETKKELKYDAAMELAHVHEKEFGDLNEAIRYYTVAYDSQPEKPQPVASLERLYEETENWRELINILWDKVEKSEDPEEILDLKLKIAELLDDRRQTPSKAVDVLKGILDERPDHLPTMRTLERLYDKIGDMEEYLALLETQMDYITNDDERAAKYHQMAAVWEEHYEKIEKAMECYENIITINDRDESAFRNLARLYRQEKKWTEYIDVLYRHIDSTFDPKEKVRLYKSAAEVLDKELQEPERAIDAYNAILNEEEEDIDALKALSRLYENQEDWDNSLYISKKLVNLIDDEKDKVEIYHRLGKISEHHLGNTSEAERLFAEALALNPSYLESLNELSSIYEQRGDWIKATRMLEKAQEHTANVVDKTNYLFQAGKIYTLHLEEPSKAINLFDECLDLDPEHVEAAYLYVDILWDEKEYEKMLPHLQMLVRKYKTRDDIDKDKLQRIYYRYGVASKEVGNFKKALEAFKMAADVQRPSFPILKGLAETYKKLGKWNDAFNSYKQILVSQQQNIGEELFVDIYSNLGTIKFEQKDYRRALNFYEKALEAEPDHRETLEAMIKLYEKENNYKMVAETMEKVVETIDDVSEKVKYLQQLGEFYQNKVKEPKAAIRAYARAYKLDDSNTLLVMELIELYNQTEQWKKTVKLMKIMAERETIPKIKAQYLYGIAGICRKYIKSFDDAIEFYNASLDEDCSMDNLKSFQYIDKILTKRKDWKMQERNYRKMIKRLMSTEEDMDALVVNFWDNLAEIYRSRMRDFEMAIATFETANKIDFSLERTEKLAELYEHNEDLDNAARMYQKILEEDALNTDALGHLYEIYYNSNEYDKAWCIAAVLTSIKAADADKMGFYEQYKPGREFNAPKSVLNGEYWKSFIYNPSEDAYLRGICGALSSTVAMLKGRPHAQWNLDPSQQADPNVEGPTFTKMFFWVYQYMGLKVRPELYVLQNSRGGMGHFVANDNNQMIPMMTVGQDLLHGKMEKELVYLIAKELTYIKPEYYLLKVVGSIGEFNGLVLGAIRMANNQIQLKGDQNVINQTAGQLNNILPPQSKEYLIATIQRMISKNHMPDVSKYVKDVERTANRAALTIVQDLETAIGVAQSEPMNQGGMSIKEKKKAILNFASSEKYFELRRLLGVRVEDN